MKDVKQEWDNINKEGEKGLVLSATQHSRNDVEGDQSYGSPMTVLPQGAGSTSLMLTL